MKTSPSSSPSETFSDVLSMCCGKQKCPEARYFSDGSLEIRDDEAGAAPVRMSPEQLSLFRRWLASRGT